MLGVNCACNNIVHFVGAVFIITLGQLHFPKNRVLYPVNKVQKHYETGNARIT
jgi:hypothetical protein